MEKYTFMKAFCAFGVAVACMGVAAGCSSTENNSGTSGNSGAVAATVNGTEIYEDQITNTIQSNREQMGLSDESAWGQWLAQNKATPESIRSEIIDGFVTQEVVRQGAAAQNISVSGETVQSYVEQMKSNYNDDAAWQAALASAGVTEDEYRENIELSLIMQQLNESLATNAEPTEDQILEYAKMYATYYDGAKKSSHILFDASDEATAQEVLDKIKDGSLDFAEAAQQYSIDSSASDGGNVGWDKLTQFVTEYQTGLDGLDKGEVSDLITSQFGIHIIKCTDVFKAPEEVTSSDQLPAEFVESIKSLIVNNNNSKAYSDWVAAQKEAADIVINEMPEGLPYDIDMSQYESQSDQKAINDGATEGNAEGLAGETGETVDQENGGENVTAEGDENAPATEGNVDVPSNEPAPATEGNQEVDTSNDPGTPENPEAQGEGSAQ
ncbi:SurA N-terminal domain-containing protein [Parvibacter caecicola]|uniref:SurA N-terminal domain-containing protein n=1 Tax=Parvibacter caecicola TaxID=747645 RepID=UPI00248C90E5|nr:SurA N-terminal domain-containing protein [Parvibacter caecicola]